MKLLHGHGRTILIAISTEGYIAVYDLEDILENLSTLDGQLMDLGDDFVPSYRFDIASRLISLGARLNFLRREPEEEDTEAPLASKAIQKPKKVKDSVAESGSEVKLGRKFLENNKLGRVKYFKALLN